MNYDAPGDNVPQAPELEDRFSHTTQEDWVKGLISNFLATVTAPADSGPEYDALVAYLSE